MRLDNDAGGRCQLLFAVHHRFVGAMPTVSSTSSLEDLNAITLLRDSINMITITINDRYTGYELSLKAFQSGLEALNNILSLFESLVHDAVPDILRSSQQDDLKSKFPKLVGLKHRISVESLLGTPPQPDIISSISFGTSRAQYQVANHMAHSFNQAMSKIFSEVDMESNVQICVPVRQDVEIDMSTLYQAQRLTVASERLSILLKNKICHTGPDRHRAHMHLSGFEKPEFEMMLSLCQGTDLWQRVYFSEQYPCFETQTEIREICAELKRSYRCRKVPRMFFDQERICNDVNTQRRTMSSAKTSAKPSTRTIRQILKDEEGLRRAKGLHHREIKKNEKQRLGLRIATSLLHLYGSPFLQNVLSADTIYILPEKFQDANKDAVAEAYISCTLSSDLIERPGLIEDPVPGDHFILALTTVLLELELEEEVVVKEDDIDDFSKLPSLYMALTRLLADSEGNLDSQYYHIIDSCLRLYDQFSNIEGKEYVRKVQTELFTKVVYQLRERYEVMNNPRQLVKVITQEKVSDSNLGFMTERLPIRADYGPMKTVSEISEVSIITESLAAPSLPLPLTSDPLLLASLGTISSSKIWLERIDAINKHLNIVQRRCPTARMVKIAILDTGCDLDASCLINMSSSEARLRNHWHDWSDNSKSPIDEDPGKHGTTLVALLLRVALHAEIFVGRVAKNEEELANAAGKISEGIQHAATQWDVDIVTMSFGFPTVVTSIRDAVDDAIREKRKKSKEIVFFAAANNDGANSEELFPASYEHVISVRGTDHAGGFVKKYNPEPWPKNKGTLFGTLGDKVPYDTGDPAFKTSGCSIAAPILTGIMATIIQYVNYAANSDSRICAGLRTKEGVLSVLHYIADGDAEHERRRYVAPWKFFKRNEEDRLALIRHAIAELQQQV